MVVHPGSELIREPGLLVPGRKPVGPVVVDWSHPLARKLSRYYLFNKVAIELVGNAVSDVSGTTSASEFERNIWRQTATDTNGAYIDTGFDAGTEGSIFTKYTPLSIYDWNSVFDNAAGSNHLECWVYATGVLAARYDPNDSPAYGPSISSGDLLNIGFSWKAGESNTGNKLYVDGALYSDETAGSSTPGNININAGNTNTHGHGEYDVFIIFKERLTDSEMMRVSQDPYQFLIPA